jgi:hypothetical protein
MPRLSETIIESMYHGGGVFLVAGSLEELFPDAGV